jgi:hypothetical protein
MDPAIRAGIGPAENAHLQAWLLKDRNQGHTIRVESAT